MTCRETKKIHDMFAAFVKGYASVTAVKCTEGYCHQLLIFGDARHVFVCRATWSTLPFVLARTSARRLRSSFKTMSCAD